MTKMVLFEILNLGNWDLFGIWCLGFGVWGCQSLQFLGTPAKEARRSSSLN
jgi:hypothetical protein